MWADKRWSGHDLDVLRQNYSQTDTSDLAKQLGRTTRAIYSMALKLRLKKSAEYYASCKSGRFSQGSRIGKNTRFRMDQKPWNFGVQGYQAGGRSKETQFKPGNRPSTWKPVGSERVVKDGYLQRKVCDTGYHYRDWVCVHILLWREHKGEIPPGRVVIFIDGDKTNVRIDNLQIITRAELAYLNNRGYSDMPAELRPSAIALAQLVCKKKERMRSA